MNRRRSASPSLTALSMRELVSLLPRRTYEKNFSNQERITPHRLRKTFASAFIFLRVPVRQIESKIVKVDDRASMSHARPHVYVGVCPRFPAVEKNTEITIISVFQERRIKLYREKTYLSLFHSTRARLSFRLFSFEKSLGYKDNCRKIEN